MKGSSSTKEAALGREGLTTMPINQTAAKPTQKEATAFESRLNSRSPTSFIRRAP